MARLRFSTRVDFSQLIYLRFFFSITLTKLAWMVWMFAVSSSRTTVRRDVTKTRNGERARRTVKWKMRQPALDVNSVVLTAHLSAPVLTSAWNFPASFLARPPVPQSRIIIIRFCVSVKLLACENISGLPMLAELRENERMISSQFQNKLQACVV